MCSLVSHMFKHLLCILQVLNILSFRDRQSVNFVYIAMHFNTENPQAVNYTVLFL